MDMNIYDYVRGREVCSRKRKNFRSQQILERRTFQISLEEKVEQTGSEFLIMTAPHY